MGDIILNIGNPKYSTRKLSEQINEFIKVAGYKIHIQISVAHLHTKNKLSERKSKKEISFIIAPKHKIPRNKFNQRGKRPAIRR